MKQSRAMNQGSHKSLPLEALRGLAAISVLFWHVTVGFFPQWSGVFREKWPGASLDGEIWFGLIHGPSAVTLFFVLSGFVLTRRFLIDGDHQIILRGAIKRWPRLAGPALLAALTSWALFKLGAYRFKEGGAITGSEWLSLFAYGIGEGFKPGFWDALGQGAFLTFFRGKAYYDSNLWTMRPELTGSFIAFGLALLVSLVPSRLVALRAAMIAMVVLFCYFGSSLYAAFPTGVALAAFLPARTRLLPGWAVAVALGLAVYLLGYTGVETGAFSILARALHSRHAADDLTFVAVIHILASALLIAAIELAPDGLHRRMSGRAAHLLGVLSFPLYLVHILILCSLGCMVLILMTPVSSALTAGLAAGVATILGSFLASVPFALFNERWVAFINRATDRMLEPSLAATKAPSRSETTPDILLSSRASSAKASPANA
ncbi:MAG: acyltransferase [Hyphomicrobiales bacterium]|nr:acyltransferase [Hyphomicrobiales bacterium]